MRCSMPGTVSTTIWPLAWYTEEAATLANQMLERLRSWVEKP